eukprot:COSAG01_NODE_709_length_14119_cov_107.401213_6_plen_105_part_00
MWRLRFAYVAAEICLCHAYSCQEISPEWWESAAGGGRAAEAVCACSFCALRVVGAIERAACRRFAHPRRANHARLLWQELAAATVAADQAGMLKPRGLELVRIY